MSLSATLLAHQRGTRTRPNLTVTLSRQRFGIPLFRFAEIDSDDTQPDCPVAIISVAGSTLLLVRENAGALQWNPAGTWTTLDTITTGQGFATARDPIAGVNLLVYADGNDLKLRTSADSYATPTTLVTEASPIGAVALAVRASNGNACAFYAIGTSTVVKRLRRTSGTWAGSGTAWTKGSDVASITGLAAVHNTDFQLVATGTEVTTTAEKVWAVAMGDGGLPANAWSGLVTIAEADSAAALSFAYPAVARHGDVLFACFQQTEAGNVATSRVMLTSTTESGDPLAHWTEPFPTRPVDTTHGAAINSNSASLFTLAGPREFFRADHEDDIDLSDRVLSCSWRETPTSLRLRLELAWHDEPAGSIFDDFGSPIGMDLAVAHGYTTSEGVEDGITVRANVARFARRFTPGKLTAVLDCDGPWEAMARYRAPQAWTAPAAYTREQIFSRVAGRVGVEVFEDGVKTPSTAWSTDAPGFAVAAGERASTTLERLIAPTPDFTRLDGATGALVICGSFADDDEPSTEGELWLSITFEDFHPMTGFTLIEEHETNWVRLQASDRYADAFYFDQRVTLEGGGEPFAPIMEHVRDLTADDDAETTAAAGYALLRRQLLAPKAELTAAFHAGVELFDVISPFVITKGFDFLLTPASSLRVIGRGADYKAGTAGPAYTSTLTLGRL